MPTELERFWSFVDVRVGECWPWKGAIVKGYGMFYIKRNGRRLMVNASKYMLELTLKRPLHPGYLACHIRACPLKRCVHPSHLYEGTRSQNAEDAVATGTHPQSAKTHCPQGHEYTDANTIWYGKMRRCRPCDIARKRAARA